MSFSQLRSFPCPHSCSLLRLPPLPPLPYPLLPLYFPHPCPLSFAPLSRPPSMSPPLSSPCRAYLSPFSAPPRYSPGQPGSPEDAAVCACLFVDVNCVSAIRRLVEPRGMRTDCEVLWWVGEDLRERENKYVFLRFYSLIFTPQQMFGLDLYFDLEGKLFVSYRAILRWSGWRSVSQQPEGRLLKQRNTT